MFTITQYEHGRFNISVTILLSYLNETGRDFNFLQFSISWKVKSYLFWEGMGGLSTTQLVIAIRGIGNCGYIWRGMAAEQNPSQ